MQLRHILPKSLLFYLSSSKQCSICCHPIILHFTESQSLGDDKWISFMINEEFEHRLFKAYTYVWDTLKTCSINHWKCRRIIYCVFNLHLLNFPLLYSPKSQQIEILFKYPCLKDPGRTVALPDYY